MSKETGERIKAIREETGLTRKEFCEKYDLPYSTMTDWELDRREPPEYFIRMLAYYVKMHKKEK